MRDVVVPCLTGSPPRTRGGRTGQRSRRWAVNGSPPRARGGRTTSLALSVSYAGSPPPARGGRKTASGVGLWSSAHPRAGRTVLVKFGEPLFDGFTLAREEDRVLAE